MQNEISSAIDARRRRRRLTAALKQSLREMGNQLSLLNRHVGRHAQLKDIDLDCLELLARHGPLNPSALARHAGLHPATVTGVLDRLQRGDWVARERDPEAADRRAVTVRTLRHRGAELFRLYAGMNAAMDRICADYTDAELELLADFFRRVTSAGNTAAEELADR